MAHTYEELKGKTIAELRDIAKDLTHEAVQGHSQMNKDHLLPALCTALGIEAYEHHAVMGIDKPALKTKMRELKKQRDAAIEAGDRAQLKDVRRHIHHLNHQIRAHMS
jgi:DNA-binding IclR family transcriptional regulator